VDLVADAAAVAVAIAGVLLLPLSTAALFSPFLSAARLESHLGRDGAFSDSPYITFCNTTGLGSVRN